MANNNDDLYGDIYADEFQEFLDDDAPAPADSNAMQDIQEESTPTPAPPASAGVPAKPVPSYSAQIAQQFQSYKQDPAQERGRRVNPVGDSGLPSAIGVYTSAATGTARLNPREREFNGCVFGKKPSEMRDAGKLFVGGLSWGTTEESLLAYFQQFGKIDALTIPRTTDPTNPSQSQSRGFAFLTYVDSASLSNVLDGGRIHEVDGKVIDPKPALPPNSTTSAPSASGATRTSTPSNAPHPGHARFFVGGLAPVTTSQGLRAFFEGLGVGKVLDATVLTDKVTQRSKGFGFITFEDPSPSSASSSASSTTLTDGAPEAANTDAKEGTADTKESTGHLKVNDMLGKCGLILDGKEIELRTAQARSQRHDTSQTPMNLSGGMAGTNSTRNMVKSITGARGMNSNPNPMAAMGMGMNPMAMAGMNPMTMGMGGMGMGGMPGMGMGGMGMGGMMNGMNPMAAMSAMGNMPNGANNANASNPMANMVGAQGAAGAGGNMAGAGAQGAMNPLMLGAMGMANPMMGMMLMNMNRMGAAMGGGMPNMNNTSGTGATANGGATDGQQNANAGAAMAGMNPMLMAQMQQMGMNPMAAMSAMGMGGGMNMPGANAGGNTNTTAVPNNTMGAANNNNNSMANMNAMRMGMGMGMNPMAAMAGMGGMGMGGNMNGMNGMSGGGMRNGGMHATKMGGTGGTGAGPMRGTGGAGRKSTGFHPYSR